MLNDSTQLSIGSNQVKVEKRVTITFPPYKKYNLVYD